MPGQMLRATPTLLLGWATHARLPDYRVVVNLAHQGTILHSVLAETPLTAEEAGGAATQGGFRIDPQALGIPPAGIPGLRLSIGETDERIAVPGAAADGMLMIEEILSDAPRARPWVTGRTYRDAEDGGLSVEIIVDLFYRDYLGRPSDPEGLAHYSSSIRSGALNYDGLRRGLLKSDEFRTRRKYPDIAPGSIFSQWMVMAASGEAHAAPRPIVPRAAPTQSAPDQDTASLGATAQPAAATV